MANKKTPKKAFALFNEYMNFYQAHTDEPSVYEPEAWKEWVIKTAKDINPHYPKDNPAFDKSVAQTAESFLLVVRERLETEPRRKVGDPGVSDGMAPEIVNSQRKVSMAWIINFRGTQRTDMNYEQITEVGRELYQRLQGN